MQLPEILATVEDFRLLDLPHSSLLPVVCLHLLRRTSFSHCRTQYVWHRIVGETQKNAESVTLLGFTHRMKYVRVASSVVIKLCMLFLKEETP